MDEEAKHLGNNGHFFFNPDGQQSLSIILMLFHFMFHFDFVGLSCSILTFFDDYFQLSFGLKMVLNLVRV